MRGMYDAERSGEMEMMRMRGSGALGALGASLAVAIEDWFSLLMSRYDNQKKKISKHCCSYIQHRALVRAPTSAQGA